MSETSQEHKEKALKQVRFGLLTISTSRYDKKNRGEPFTDASAELAEKILTASGHKVVLRKVISDDSEMIQEGICQLVSDHSVDAVLGMGGTGITPTDVTVETVVPLFEKGFEGFGEAFRRISYDEIGGAAIVSRCTAGIMRGKVVFCLPGSPQAVETALKKLIIPEVGHILVHARAKANS